MNGTYIAARARATRHAFEAVARVAKKMIRDLSIGDGLARRPVEPPEEELPMQYMILIYADESGFSAPATPEEVGAMMEPWNAYTQALRDAGVFVAGDALNSTATATTVRVRDGKTLHTDGPFAETREQLGGYYLIECADLDAAIAWGARCPGALYGSIEVRPVMVYG